jgi:hypothetical protein
LTIFGLCLEINFAKIFYQLCGREVTTTASYLGSLRLKSGPQRLDNLTESFSFCSSVIPGKHLNSTLKQAMTTSFHILSNTSFTNFHVQNCIEINENPANKISMDDDRLWEAIRVFEYLKNFQWRLWTQVVRTQLLFITLALSESRKQENKCFQHCL